MVSYRLRLLDHGTRIRSILRRVYNLVFFLDHVTSSNRNLVSTQRPVEFSSINSLLVVYATYGEFDSSNIEKLKAFFGSCLLVIENVDEGKSSNLHSNYVRKNLGFDLGMFRDAIRIIKRNEFSGNILLINSSAEWNVDVLSNSLPSIQKTNKLVFLTESFQGVQHFQTFFIYVPEVLLTQFAAFIERRWLNWRFKRSAVVFGEQRTSSLRDLHIPVHVFYDFSYCIDAKRLQRVNPALDLIPVLIDHPIFKKHRK